MNGPKYWKVAILTHLLESLLNLSKRETSCYCFVSFVAIAEISGSISTHAFLTDQIASVLSFRYTGIITPTNIYWPIIWAILTNLSTSSRLTLKTGSSASDTISYNSLSLHISSPRVSAISSTSMIPVNLRSSSSPSPKFSIIMGMMHYSTSCGVKVFVIVTSWEIALSYKSFFKLSSNLS